MEKKSRVETGKKVEPEEETGSLFKSSAKVDSGLAALFAAQPASQSTKKAKTVPVTKQVVVSRPKKGEKESSDSEEDDSSDNGTSASSSAESDDEELSSISEDAVSDEEESASAVAPEARAAEVEAALEEGTTKSRRKRKRDDEDLEAKYLEKLAKEEEKKEAQRAGDRQSKRQKAVQANPNKKATTNGAAADSDAEMGNSDKEDDEDFEVPQHESLAKPQDSEIDKANRTVFLGNVSSEAVTSKTAKKTLIQHMSSFLEKMSKGQGKEQEKHKVESIRFRSTAYTNMLPKKASFVTQDLMDTTTKSTNAYVVYSTKAASREALKLNGTVVLGRHLRVDSVAHPSKSDPRRCVFVGNLSFVDDESAIQAAEAEEGKKMPRKKAPSDIEEGLWREFGKCGTVENVRVVRDSKTRVAKGIAYVQFVDENAVEAALLYNDKRFPPMLPRKLRVSRAKGIKRNVAKKDTWSRPATNGVYNPKMSEEQKSAMGRASKLLGRAGAAMINRPDVPSSDLTASEKANDLKAPESFVFEGHRATKGSLPGGKKLGKSKKNAKKPGRPTNRSARRAKEWKFGGGGDK